MPSFDTSLSGEIIRCAYEVHGTLGTGFLESVYRTSFTHELALAGFRAEMERKIDVFYKGSKVGLYYADILVEDFFIIECKSVLAIIREHVHQVRNYLTATGLKDALIFNFKPKVLEFMRVFPG